MKILIVGANSTIAKHVIPVLSEGHTVITAGREGCDIIYDVTEGGNIRQSVDVVINFAAAFHGDSDDDITQTIQTNVLGTLEVCKTAKNAGARHIIDISSIFASLPEQEVRQSLYALTKRQADEIAAFYCETNNLPLTILRPARVYGATDDFLKHQPFLYQMFDKAAHGEDILLYGSNDPKRNYIHISDLANIIRRVVDTRTIGTYLCTYPHFVTYAGIAQIAQQVFSKGGEVKFLKDKPDIPNDNFPSESILYNLLDYSPTIDMEEGIRGIKEQRVER